MPFCPPEVSIKSCYFAFSFKHLKVTYINKCDYFVYFTEQLAGTGIKQFMNQ